VGTEPKVASKCPVCWCVSDPYKAPLVLRWLFGCQQTKPAACYIHCISIYSCPVCTPYRPLRGLPAPPNPAQDNMRYLLEALAAMEEVAKEKLARLDFSPTQNRPGTMHNKWTVDPEGHMQTKPARHGFGPTPDNILDEYRMSLHAFTRRSLGEQSSWSRISGTQGRPHAHAAKNSGNASGRT
jgi:hypothetical protein